MGVTKVEDGEGEMLNREEMRAGGDGEKEGAVGVEKVRKVPRNVVRFPKKKVEQDKGDEVS
jgi:hypothetical protein